MYGYTLQSFSLLYLATLLPFHLATLPSYYLASLPPRLLPRLPPPYYLTPSLPYHLTTSPLNSRQCMFRQARNGGAARGLRSPRLRDRTLGLPYLAHTFSLHLGEVPCALGRAVLCCAGLLQRKFYPVLRSHVEHAAALALCSLGREDR